MYYIYDTYNVTLVHIERVGWKIKSSRSLGARHPVGSGTQSKNHLVVRLIVSTRKLRLCRLNEVI